jgi:hypothetical protein
VIAETMRVVNVTQALAPRAPVFLGGMSEALNANGWSTSIRILRNYSAPD